MKSVDKSQIELIRNILFDADRIPQELKEHGRFCCWKLQPNDKGRPTKRPFNPTTNQMVKPDDRNTFVGFDTAMDGMADGYDGIGLGMFDNLAFIDLDDCVAADGNLSALAKDILAKTDTYTELSPSGNGLHLYGFVKEGFSYDTEEYYVKKPEIEIYISGMTNRYGTMTSTTLTADTMELTDITGLIGYILETYMKRPVAQKPAPTPNLSVITREDKNYLQIGLEKKPQFKALYNREYLPFPNDESQNDMSLIAQLAFWCNGDYDTIYQEFINSPFCKGKDKEHLKKIQRKDYLPNTINYVLRTMDSNAKMQDTKYKIQKEIEQMTKQDNTTEKQAVKQKPVKDTKPTKEIQADFELDKDQHGKVYATTKNFLSILRNDYHFKYVRFNVLREATESVKDGKRTLWTDNHDAMAQNYIEDRYGIFNNQKYESAFKQFELEREYNPVEEMIKAIQWDGNRRVDTFLTKWMGCEDNQYHRECSRLIFSGGINRAFNRGCKFDCIITLVGSQGCGKSTLCRELAMDEYFYSSCKTLKGKEGVESLLGKWIVELEELLATIKDTDEESKAFLSKNIDYMRLAYGHRPLDLPRGNIFIGTTNKDAFLSDQTGNRRWFPVRCHQEGTYIYDHIEELRQDIQQCWAEMYSAYEQGDDFANTTEDRTLIEEIRKQQADAEMDDYRIGIIRDYLVGRNKVCLIEIWVKALGKNEKDYNPRRDGCELGTILTNKCGLIRGMPDRFGEFKTQKSFIKPTGEVTPFDFTD